MPRINVNLSDEMIAVIKGLPKNSRGRFVDTAIRNFVKSPDGEKILTFFKPSEAGTTLVTDSGRTAQGLSDVDGILSEFMDNQEPI